MKKLKIELKIFIDISFQRPAKIITVLLTIKRLAFSKVPLDAAA